MVHMVWVRERGSQRGAWPAKDQAQMRRSLYVSKTESMLRTGRFSAWDWAMSMRSKGSLCGPGSRPARAAWAEVIGSDSNDSWARMASKRRAKSAAPGSLPRRDLVAISHAEAALTKMMLERELISLRTRGGSAGSSVSHQSKAWVSKRRFRSHSQSSISSSGRGSKNSEPMRNFPFMLPGLR